MTDLPPNTNSIQTHAEILEMLDRVKKAKAEYLARLKQPKPKLKHIRIEMQRLVTPDEVEQSKAVVETAYQKVLDWFSERDLMNHSVQKGFHPQESGKKLFWLAVSVSVPCGKDDKKNDISNELRKMISSLLPGFKCKSKKRQQHYKQAKS